ncbi:hypothetical protein SAMN06269185_3152 [Natronoarchaeum philippinense]|uniref:Small CPxCG-related zinc finger protein n=1 Tax=Natronoarchaeum philippinense TaxID=558529 RepID=A0A285P825_NATPI|nr:hypothetical protein [Natronoarchaeum philippinense]SNZ17874.1 hypothetical protein SAMN06269185_3152 [Natronoarchaeum philippinense]
MVDPTSDLGEDVDEDDAPECAVCGDPIVENRDHVVRSWIEDDEVQHRHFCSDECEAEFDAEH